MNGLICRLLILMFLYFSRLMTRMLWKIYTHFWLILPPQKVHTFSHQLGIKLYSLFTGLCAHMCSFGFFSGFYSCNTEIMPGIQNWTSAIQVSHPEQWQKYWLFTCLKSWLIENHSQKSYKKGKERWFTKSDANWHHERCVQSAKQYNTKNVLV